MPIDNQTNDNSREQGVFRHALRRARGRFAATNIASALEASPAARHSDEAVEAWVDLAQAMLDGGRVTEDEYLLFATFAIEGLHNKRWSDGEYPELAAISREMKIIEREAGLVEGEYWLIADAPSEYRVLSERYDAALDFRFAETLDQFGLDQLSQLWRTDRAQYDRRRETARRALFEKDNKQKSVAGMISVYEAEAALSAAAGAYFAACVMFGSAAEARLLDMCLDNPSEVSGALATMSRAEAPRNSDPLHWNLEHLVLVAERAGWIIELENDDVKLDVAGWLLSLRDTRNLLHPGRHARDRPHVIMGAEAHGDALLSYEALCIGLERHRINKLASEAQARPSPISDR